MFNIGPRNRLHLTIGFDHTLTLGEYAPRRRDFIYRAVYMLSVIRLFLLRGARALNLEYEGIRVNTEWEAPRIDPSRARQRRYFARVVADRQVMVECDDEYIPESNQSGPSYLLTVTSWQGSQPGATWLLMTHRRWSNPVRREGTASEQDLKIKGVHLQLRKGKGADERN